VAAAGRRRARLQVGRRSAGWRWCGRRERILAAFLLAHRERHIDRITFVTLFADALWAGSAGESSAASLTLAFFILAVLSGDIGRTSPAAFGVAQHVVAGRRYGDNIYDGAAWRL
jgi:hypothetical protein